MTERFSEDLEELEKMFIKEISVDRKVDTQRLKALVKLAQSITTEDKE